MILKYFHIKKMVKLLNSEFPFQRPDIEHLANINPMWTLDDFFITLNIMFKYLHVLSLNTYILG